MNKLTHRDTDSDWTVPYSSSSELRFQLMQLVELKAEPFLKLTILLGLKVIFRPNIFFCLITDLTVFWCISNII